MKILALPAALLALSSVAAGATDGAELKRRPSIAVVSDSPLTVTGRGFRRFERVTVRTSVAGTAYMRRARAGRAGRFTTRFAGVSAECHPFVITAVGGWGKPRGGKAHPDPGAVRYVIQP